MKTVPVILTEFTSDDLEEGDTVEETYVWDDSEIGYHLVKRELIKAEQ
jgi:hypothetical protein